MVRSRSLIARVLLWLVFSTPAFADTQVSNLDEPYQVSLNSNGVHFAMASSFTTGAESTRLESVTVSVFTNTTGSSELRLRADAGGAPGALLESLGTQTLPSNQGQVSLTYASTGAVLDPATSYWLTLGETGSGDFAWAGTFSTLETSPASWTIGDQVMVRPAGSPGWDPLSAGPPNESGLFSVQADPLWLSGDWATIGAPGNACDLQQEGCFGSVAYVYEMARYEVTNAEFVDFLNAVAADDPNGLYNADMSIARSGSPGSYAYSVDPLYEDQPLTALSFYDALRYANWLHNDRPIGPQGPATTEHGAYTFSGPLVVGPRNPGARFALPTEDEWYKAAYYDPDSAVWYDWPTGSFVPPTCSGPTAAANHANCYDAWGAFTDVGSYPGAPSPFGTYDQGGNAWEWNETAIGAERGLRGGSQGPATPVATLSASSRYSADPASEGVDVNLVGFRMVPEPGRAESLAVGIVSLLVLARTRGDQSRVSAPDRL